MTFLTRCDIFTLDEISNVVLFLVYKELIQFATGDLSSFYFEISKDKLYTMSKNSQHRKSCQTVLLKILDALSKAMAPILCHTAEDIFRHSPILQEIKKPGTDSIHAQGWFDLVSSKQYNWKSVALIFGAILGTRVDQS